VPLNFSDKDTSETRALFQNIYEMINNLPVFNLQMTNAVVTKNFGEVSDIVYSLKIYFVLPACVIIVSLNVIKVARELLGKCCCCFKCSSLQPLKVAQNSFQYFPTLRF